MSEQTKPNAPDERAAPRASCVNKEFDEFSNKTTITHRNELRFMAGSEGCVFQLRYVKNKDHSFILLDCTLRSKDWFFLRNGNIIFNCDQENYEVDFHESQTDVHSNGDTKFDNMLQMIRSDKEVYCYESGYYELPQDLLRKICDAKILKIRVTGAKYVDREGEWCALFQSHCRQFYNNVFDETLYLNAIPAASPKRSENSGCFIATACYGDYEHPIVMELRRFRDEILQPMKIGCGFVRWYYQWSPPFAGFIGKNDTLKGLARVLIVAPTLALARIARKIQYKT